MAVQIPLFPLSVVLFPHMPLALHIFEERYRDMMSDCREQGQSFGIVAIRDDPEAGGFPEPYPVGTLAQFHEVDELEDGRFRLMVTGASRFRVQEIVPGRPYLQASVRYLQDLPGNASDLATLVIKVEEAFKQYDAALSTLSGEPHEETQVPEDPELLSYLVAASLQIELSLKQSLLEIDSAAGRLRRCLHLLRREIAVLGAMLAHQDTPPAAFSRN